MWTSKAPPFLSIQGEVMLVYHKSMTKKNYKLIILDRDGVINEDSIDYIKSPEEWHAITGSLEAIAKLNKAGYKIIVISNQ